LLSILNAHPGGSDAAYGVAVDAIGNVYMTGYTTTTGFPVQDEYLGYTGPLQGGYFYGFHTSQPFLARFNPTGSLLYSTNLGGRLEDAGTAVAVDGSGGAYITGYSSSSDFPLQTPAPNPQYRRFRCLRFQVHFSTPAVSVLFGVQNRFGDSWDAAFSASAPITISGSGCSPANYTAASMLKITD
jgi:hypothetical protein